MGGFPHYCGTMVQFALSGYLFLRAKKRGKNFYVFVSSDFAKLRMVGSAPPMQGIFSAAEWRLVGRSIMSQNLNLPIDWGSK